MTRRVLLLAVACSLVLSGCLDGLNAASSDAGVTTDTPAETTAETDESGPQRATYETYEPLAANASFSVPDPDVPEEFAFQSGTLMELGGDEHVVSAYHRVTDGEIENVVSVRKTDDDSLYDPAVGNATTVGVREGRYVETEDGGAKLLWQCDGYSYRVSVQQYADGVGEDDLRSVAESVGCE
jgi:hypothetical protein